MRVWPGLSFFILLISLQVNAIDATVGHTVFFLPVQAGGNLKPYVEAYWQVNPRTLIYSVQPDSSLVANIKTHVILKNEQGIIKEEQFILKTAPKTGKAALLSQNILDLHRYILPYGKISLQVILKDQADSTNKYSYTDTFTIARQDSVAHYSGVEILDTAYLSSLQGIFQKNNMQQIPYCSNFLDNARNTLHYYFELYNTNAIPKEQYPLTEFIFISKKENDVILTDYIKTDTIFTASNDVRPYVGQFDISGLISGNYYLGISLRNKLREEVTSHSYFFQRFNNKPVVIDTAATQRIDTAQERVEVLDLHKTFLAKYTLPQVEAILRMLLPLSDQTEVMNINNFLKKPDEKYMRYYVYNFFASINPKEPEKAWKEYSNQVREVNKLFGSSFSKGYETDRGMVYLRYGKPTDRLIVENEVNTYPYEIWQYNVLTVRNRKIANGLFLFYKPSEMITDMRLLHSNVPGEIRNTSWRKYLYVSGSGNSDNRAEQYIGSN